MSEFSTSIVPDFMPWALMVANVGTWRCSIAREWVWCDSVMADMWGLTEGEAHHGVPFSRIRGVIHPDDKIIFDRKNEDVHKTGGGVVMEYRIIPKPRVLRWVLVRGRYEVQPGTDRAMTGHGIAIDITEARAEGDPQEVAVYARLIRPRDMDLTALHRASDAAIALRREVDTLADAANLRAATDMVLRLLARRLAREVPRDVVE